MIHVITSRRDNNIVKKNTQENISIFNQIIHNQEKWNKLISIPKKTTSPDNVGDVVKIPLRSEWNDTVLTHSEKMSKSTTFGGLYLRS